MKQLKYIGPHPQVEVEVAPKKWETVTRGESFDVADPLAEALLEQPDNWKSTKAKAAKTADTKTPPNSDDDSKKES